MGLGLMPSGEHMTCTRLTFTVVLATTWWCAASRAQTTRPATAPTTAPATQPVRYTSEAQSLLDAVRDAYAMLDSLEVTGTLALDLDVAGQQQSRRSAFTGAMVAPNKFRHE